MQAADVRRVFREGNQVLSYRLYQDGDFPKLQRLWEEATDWGTLTPEMWHKYVEDYWFGPPAICVAVDESNGRIEGQMVYLRSRVFVQGREFLAFRAAAAVISKNLRAEKNSLDPEQHPSRQMMAFLEQMLQKENCGLVYLKPDAHWMLLLKMRSDLLTATFPLWSIPLPMAGTFAMDPRYTCSPLTEFDERVDELWEAAARWYGCATVRTREILRRKAPPPDFNVLAIEARHELTALVCTRGSRGQQHLICDLLARDEDSLRAAIIAASNASHEKCMAAGATKTAKVAILATPIAQPALRSLGFQRDSYNFPMAVRILDNSIRPEEVEPSRWYLSAND